MTVSRSSYTDSLGFYGDSSPSALLEKYGSPLYVYNEEILRRSCATLKGALTIPRGSVVFSTKANSNPHLLRIIREEGLMADAMSPGEVAMLQEAGFRRDEIVYVCNNVGSEELRFAKESASLVSVDSLDQLESFGRVNPQSDVMVRLNPGIGAGHHKKVITAGKETKFGMALENTDDLENILAIAARYSLRIVGLNQHVGSLFMDTAPYLEAVKWLLEKSSLFPEVEVLDFGGGFGIPYGKYSGEAPFDVASLGASLEEILSRWVDETGYSGRFLIEPGRFVAAESALVLSRVQGIKENSGTVYVGTDIGFSVLARPMLYDAFHDIEVYALDAEAGDNRVEKEQTIVGNICESGDIVAKDRLLPELKKGDIIGVLDAGAYGHVMSSNYTKRLRPAEVLVTLDGTLRLIRRRDSLEDLLTVYRV